MIKVSIIGSGNVAQHLIQVFLQTPEVTLVQVMARNANSVSHLVPQSKIISNITQLEKVDVCIVSVTDNAIAEVAAQLPFQQQLVVHTSGSTELTALGLNNRKGVFYPLQTFSKNKTVDFSNIPLCLEAENENDYKLLEQLAHAISKNVYRISSEQRKSLHVAAVFVSNFVNHMYYIGSEICKEHHIPFEILQPLIQEVAHKVTELPPAEAQTGPALRNDTKTLNKHIAFLENSNYQDIYKLLTQSIQNVKKL